MTDKPFSLIDTFLEETEPQWESLGLKKPKQIGEQFKDLSKSEADDAFLTEIGGDSNHTVVPGARIGSGGRETKPVKDATTGDSALADAFKSLGAVENHNELDELTESEIKGRIEYLLSLGHKPSRVAGMIEKLAELKLFDRKQTAEFLSDQAGGMGLAYIEPNFYMNSCDKSHAEIQKNGNLRALSVKKIAACSGCQHYRCGSCSLYSRPVVASAQELKNVVTAAVQQKGIKVATTLKAALVQMHEGVGAKEAQNLPYHRSEEQTVTRTAGDKKAMVHKEASVEEVGKMVSSGVPLNKIYKDASAQYGKVSAMSAIKRYIAGLKQSKAKIVLAALDCSFLKNKLASSNTIVGEKKCASCSYRNGMSCGLTGGTLLTFPGMDKASSKKISHEGVKDGKEVLYEFDLLDNKEDSEIEYRGEDGSTPEEINIELTRPSSIDIED